MSFLFVVLLRLCPTNIGLLVSSISHHSHQEKKDEFIVLNYVDFMVSDRSDRRVSVLTRASSSPALWHI